ncbi:MAG: hypothetical protein WCI76_02035 [bacterium]
MENNQSELVSQPAPEVVMGAPVLKNKKLVISIIILFFVAALGFAFAFYSGTFVTLPTLLKTSMEKAKTTTSATYDVTFNADFSEIKDVTNQLSGLSFVGGNTSQMAFSFRGSYDLADRNNVKHSSTLSLGLGSLSLESEFKLINKIFYVKLTKYPLMAKMFLPTLSTYENKWFSLPYEATKAVSGELTADQKDKITKLSENAHLIKALAKLSPETVSGEPSYHFSFDLDRGGIVAYINSLKDYAATLSKNNPDLSEVNTKTITESMDKIKDFKGEIWIGRNDQLVHKITVSFAVQPDATKDEKVKVNMVAIFSDYNKPLEITAPAGSTPFSDIMPALMSPVKVKEMK